MTALRLAALLALLGTPALAQGEHHCAADAREKAGKLLAFHYDVADGGVEVGVSDEVRELAPLAALRGDGELDVLEVWGYVYRAEYRMRFIYAQFPDSCALMGQEIIEDSDPY